jgi:hypothetical protein
VGIFDIVDMVDGMLVVVAVGTNVDNKIDESVFVGVVGVGGIVVTNTIDCVGAIVGCFVGVIVVGGFFFEREASGDGD